MTRRALLTSLLIAVLLLGAFWLNAGALVRSWEDEELAIQQPLKIEARLGEDASLEISGQGLVEGTRAWLVPEQTLRNALTASIRTWGNPRQILLAKDVAYIANGKGGILCVDLHDWSRPRLISGFKLTHMAQEMVLVDGLLYVAGAQGGLQVVDVRDPATPTLAASLTLPGSALALSLQNQYLYIATGSSGLVVVDISQPRQPRLITQIKTPGTAIDITVCGNTALLACGREGIARFNISNPRRPLALPALHPDGLVRCLDGQDTTVYVGSYETGASASPRLTVYDCSDPHAPQKKMQLTLPGEPATIHAQDRLLTVALGYNGVSRFDLAEPQHPRLIDTISDVGPINCAIYKDGWTFLADRSGYLHSLQLSDRLQLPKISTLFNRVPAGRPLLQDDLLLLPLRNDFLQIYAAQDPTHPEWLADLSLPGNVSAMALRGDQLILTTGNFNNASAVQDGHLTVISLADPRRPEFQSQTHLTGSPTDLVVDQSMVVVVMAKRQMNPATQTTEVSGVMSVLRLRDNMAPETLHWLDLKDSPTGVALRDGHAIVSFASGGVQTFRLSEQKMPELVGEVNIPWIHAGNKTQRGGIVLCGGLAAVANGTTELNFIDVSSPRRPFLLGSGELPGFIDQLLIDGNMLYVGIINQGIMLYDLTYPWQPRQVGLLALPRSGNSFVVGEDILWYGGSTRQGMTCISKPLLAKTDEAANGRSLSLQLPAPLATGDYALWVERDNRWQEIPNAVRFSAR